MNARLTAAIGHAELCALIPHGGAMCLLDAVLAWDADAIHCRAIGHTDPQHPLARDGRLDALHLIEYGAQAMAIHGGLRARAAGTSAPPGLLAAARDVQFEVARIDNLEAPLDVQARRLLANAGGWLYEFSIAAAGRPLARGRLTVMPQR